MGGKAGILKDFLFDMNPVALRKAKIVYNFGLLSILCSTFLFFFLSVKSSICILRRKKSFQRKKKFLLTYPIFSGCNLNQTYFFLFSLTEF